MKAEKDFLVGCLTRAGIKSQVLKSWKELERYADSHVGAVLSEGQVLARDGLKTQLYRPKWGSVHTDLHLHCGFKV